jgi:hypothetical protein
MKNLLLFVLIPLVSALTRADELPSGFLRTFALDEHTAFQIPVAYERGVTTLVFPEPPQNYAAARVAFLEAGKSVPDFSGDNRIDFVVLTHLGSPTCSIRALRPEAQDTLSVYLDGKVYQLFLRAEADKPLLTVEFHFRPTVAVRSGETVSPNRLIDCLTRAKAYPLLSKYYPDQLDGITRAAPDRLVRYPDFRIQISEIFRFEAEDTLVFHLLLQNETSHDIAYKPAELSVRVEPQTPNLRDAPPIYSASIVDASGLMPTHSVTTAWFAITGTRDGGRNDLDPARNIFTVLVPRVAFPAAITPRLSTPSVDPKDAR